MVFVRTFSSYLFFSLRFSFLCCQDPADIYIYFPFSKEIIMKFVLLDCQAETLSVCVCVCV